ncbi:MAG: dockerin [Oscillospiraceae bacterium]|nr:dockerin [Oscillospiraceae bacterium]
MKKLLAILTSFAMLYTITIHLPVLRGHADDSKLIVYPQYDERIPRCYDYGVTVHQGNHSERLTVYNRNTSGEQMTLRCFKPDFNRRFCEFAFTGEVRVDIEVYQDFSSYSILPSAKEYRNEYHDGIISVWLNENDTHFILRLDDDDDSILSIFADAPEDYEINKNDDSVLYVDEKWYDPDDSSAVYIVPENIKTVYIAPGSVLYSRLFVKTKDVTVCGHGVLIDPYSNVYDTTITSEENSKMVLRVQANHTIIKDIKVIDSQNFNIFLEGGSGHTVENVKCLSSRITTDGIAVGAGNVEIHNCFFYVGDNAIVYSGGAGYHHISDCIIGTTCAAIFPQHRSPYEIEFKDNYVFRANEGIVNNWFNGAQIQSEMKHMTFENLDCSDVIDTPWIFSGKNMGDAEKYYTFRNCRFANIRGDSVIKSWESTAGQAVFVINKKDNLHCSNYKMEFQNCTIDGKMITSPSDLNPQLTEGNEISFLIENDSTPETQTVGKHTVNHVYNKKVYIGDCLVPLENQPLQKGSEFYLPEQEICDAWGFPVNSDTKGEIISGIKYISLSQASIHYANAQYDSNRSAILLAPVYQSGRNLLTEKEAVSIWNPYSYPNVILSPHTDQGEVVLRCDVNQDSNNPGMFTGITNVLKQNGAGKYTIRFEAKSYDGNQYPVQIRIHNTRYEGNKLIQKTPIEAVTVNGEWSVYEAEFDLSDWDMSNNSVTHIRIGSDNTHGYDVLFRNIEMRKVVPDIIGDVNADGAFNVADVVALQKWLLAVPDVKLADWKSADLCSNNRLDVVDLCLMKRELLKNN